MTYATLDQMTDRYGERMLRLLSDRGQPPSGAVDADVVARALADADAVIDGYLAGRYRLPLAATPALVADIAAKLAIWNLHTSSPDPKIEADYTQAMRSLRDIAAGAIRLDVAGAEPEGAGRSGARITDRERPFTAENLKGFIG